MKTAVHVLTKPGLEYYHHVKYEFERMKANGLLELFLHIGNREKHNVMVNLDLFLNNETLEREFKMHEYDPDGWEIYRELDDRYAILKFYTERAEREKENC